MGVPERRSVDRVIMPSTAMPVLRAAGRPVLMVRLTSGRDVSRATAASAVTLDVTVHNRICVSGVIRRTNCSSVTSWTDATGRGG